ncbi:MAG: (4Fe-4S)-binding protein [Bacteroidota bacterium]
MQKKFNYTNGEITVSWEPDLCIHAAICFTELNEVFEPAISPWINMKGAPSDRIIEVVEKCPTAALKVRKNMENEKKNDDRSTGEEVNVTVLPNGPVIINGNFVIKGVDGNVLPKSQKVSLCRCGHSSKKPFCDGSHVKAGFKD